MESLMRELHLNRRTLASPYLDWMKPGPNGRSLHTTRPHPVPTSTGWNRAPTVGHSTQPGLTLSLPRLDETGPQRSVTAHNPASPCPYLDWMKPGPNGRSQHTTRSHPIPTSTGWNQAPTAGHSTQPGLTLSLPRLDETGPQRSVNAPKSVSSNPYLDWMKPGPSGRSQHTTRLHPVPTSTGWNRAPTAGHNTQPSLIQSLPRLDETGPKQLVTRLYSDTTPARVEQVPCSFMFIV